MNSFMTVSFKGGLMKRAYACSLLHGHLLNPHRDSAKMHKKLRWDDLLYVLEIGRRGSLSGAARALQITHSTVLRRLAAIEQRLGARLFDRQPGGYVPTAAGEAVIRLAEQLDGEVVELERRLAGQDLRPSGTVRITTTDTLVAMLVPILARFRDLYPEILLELIPASQFFNLSKRDADVALRPSLEPPAELYGRRVARIAFAPYAARTYIDSVGGRGLDSAHRWLGLDDSLSHIEPHRWLREQVESQQIVFSASSFLALVHAARAGMGVALLPCYIGDEETELARVSPPIAALATDLWLLVHNDVRNAARVRAFVDFAFRELARLRPMIEASASR
jgi:DNA-binding transcriptional LysR family regulator